MKLVALNAELGPPYIDIYKIQFNNYYVKLYKGRIIIFTIIQNFHIAIYF